MVRWGGSSNATLIVFHSSWRLYTGMTLIWQHSYGIMSIVTHVTMCMCCSAIEGYFDTRKGKSELPCWLWMVCWGESKAIHIVSHRCCRLDQEYGTEMIALLRNSATFHPWHTIPVLSATHLFLIQLKPNSRPPLLALNGVKRRKQAHPLCHCVP